METSACASADHEDTTITCQRKVKQGPKVLDGRNSMNSVSHGVTGASHHTLYPCQRILRNTSGAGWFRRLGHDSGPKSRIT